jgi:hypothetical protein
MWGVVSWFKKQMTEIHEVHTEITWQEALDNAVLRIHEIKDIESDQGKKDLKDILDGLKFRQHEHKVYMEQILNDRAKTEEGKVKDEENTKEVKAQALKPMFYLLPWEVPANSAPLRPD